MTLSAMAKAALEKHLPELQDGLHARRYGWKVDIDEESGLCHARLFRPWRNGVEEVVHDYLLRLSFDYYPIMQPGAIFVHPESREIGAAAEFERWWPNIDGNPWINVNVNQAEPAKSYLCFQWTYEFKQTHAEPEASDPKKWDPAKHT